MMSQKKIALLLALVPIAAAQAGSNSYMPVTASQPASQTNQGQGTSLVVPNSAVQVLGGPGPVASNIDDPRYGQTAGSAQTPNSSNTGAFATAGAATANVWGKITQAADGTLQQLASTTVGKVAQDAGGSGIGGQLLGRLGQSAGKDLYSLTKAGAGSAVGIGSTTGAQSAGAATSWGGISDRASSLFSGFGMDNLLNRDTIGGLAGLAGNEKLTRVANGLVGLDQLTTIDPRAWTMRDVQGVANIASAATGKGGTVMAGINTATGVSGVYKADARSGLLTQGVVATKEAAIDAWGAASTATTGKVASAGTSGPWYTPPFVNPASAKKVDPQVVERLY